MADKKISELDAVGTSADTDQIPVVQSGTTKRATLAQLMSAGGVEGLEAAWPDTVVVEGDNSTRTTKATAVQTAIDAAAGDSKSFVFVPHSFLDYDASAVTFDNSVRMVREGQVSDVYDVKAYGAAGDGTTDDTAAIKAARDAAETANGDITYEVDFGGVSLHQGHVHFPSGTYLSGPLTFTNSSIQGEGPSNTVLVHDGTGAGPDFITVGDDVANIYDFSVRDLAIQGDGELTTSSGAGTSNTTRFGIRLQRAIVKCFIENVTISQCGTGIQAESCWTLQLEKVYIFNCPKCVDWSGAVTGGARGCRFDAVWNGTTGDSNVAVIVCRDTDASVSSAAITFEACAFQKAGKDAVRLSDVRQAEFNGCLFEKCDRENGSNAYVFIDDSSTAEGTDRDYTFINCMWSPSDSEGTSSDALRIETAESVTLVGCHVKDSTTNFSNSIVTTSACRAVIAVGLTDSTAAGTSINIATKYIIIDQSGVKVGDSVYDTSATVHGNFTVDRDGDASNVQASLSGDAGTLRIMLAKTAGSNRWLWGADSSAESGSNEGSDWVLHARNDAGSSIDIPIKVERQAGGDITLSRQLGLAVFTVAGLPTAGTEGRVAYASDGRKNGESAGNGTGVQVFDDGTNWIAVDTGQTVAA